MVVVLRPWMTPVSPECHYQVYWAEMNNRFDPKPFFQNQPLGVQVRVERVVRKFAEIGKLPSKQGHPRKGRPPLNDLYEFKDTPSGLRLLAFHLKHNAPQGLATYVVVLGVCKQRDDITREEEDRALRLMGEVKEAAAAGELEIHL